MNKLIKLPLFLAGVTLIASSLLGFFHFFTEDFIETNRLNTLNEIYLRVFDFDINKKNSIDHFTDIDLSKDELADLAEQYSIIVGKIAEDSANNPVGYVFSSSSRGFADLIEVVIAFDTDFKPIGYATLSNNETPSYGKRLDEALEEFLVFQNIINDGDYSNVVVGATVSRNAVKKACNQILDFVDEIKVSGVR